MDGWMIDEGWMTRWMIEWMGRMHDGCIGRSIDGWINGCMESGIQS